MHVNIIFFKIMKRLFQNSQILLYNGIAGIGSLHYIIINNNRDRKRIKNTIMKQERKIIRK